MKKVKLTWERSPVPHRNSGNTNIINSKAVISKAGKTFFADIHSLRN